MATLADFSDNSIVKIMLIGDSGSGKTGALASLVEAGYKLRIVDMDSGLQPLAQLLKARDPKLLSQVDYVSYRDRYKATPSGTEVAGVPKAYLDACKTMDVWPNDGSKPSEWGREYVYVIDSFSLLARAALMQANHLKPASNSGKQADGRQIYGAAQTACENFLACIMGEGFRTNVIVISHITEIEFADGSKKGFPSAVGSALSRHIAKYVNDLFVVETKGFGANVRRIIRTVPNGMTDAKTSLIGLDKELPIETGLATIFKKLSGA